MQCCLGLVIAALWLAPAASADVSFVRAFPVSGPAFALDDSGRIFAARNGGVDRYSVTGAAAGGFAVASGFTAPNDLEFAAGRLYAVDASANKVYSFNPDGTGRRTSPADTDGKLNLARTLAVAGAKIYVGTGETHRVVRLSSAPTFGAFELAFGWGVSDASNAFQVCQPPGACTNPGFAGPQPGKVNDARDLAVDAAGNLYVVERESPNARVEVYSSVPAPVRVIGAEGSGAGQIDFASGVALDAAGNLYVADTENHRISQFRTDGTFVQAFGFGVSTGAAQLETCTTACLKGIGGSAPGQLSFPTKVVYDGAGNLYVSDVGPRISVFGVGPPGGGPPGDGPPGEAATQCADGRDNDGDGANDKRDPGCLSGPTGAYNPADDDESDEDLRDLVLCGRRELSLVRADLRGKKVLLSGLVSERLAGKSVAILANYGTAKDRALTKLATVTPNAEGAFRASVARPPAKLVNKARFQAKVDRFRSIKLKLPQSLASTEIESQGGQIVLRGKVKRSLLGKRNAVTVRRLLCGSYQTVGSGRPDRRGRYVVRFDAPGLATAALYRAQARVLARPGGKRYIMQFARAIGLTLTGQSG